MALKKHIKALIPKRHHHKILHLRMLFGYRSFLAKSYSGDGEDIVLQKFFCGKKNGFYVDVGAFHPKYISNTYMLHTQGWSGINIDPNTDSIKLFKKYRPNDTNLEIGISEKEESRTYYNFTYFGVNTFDEEHAKNKADLEGNELISKKEITCVPLSKILEKHTNGKHIDLLDVDVEGFDLKVLKSNNWNKFKPTVVLVEDRDFRLLLERSPIYLFLKEKGYDFHSYNNITLIMKRSDIS